jgi:hypothetical protein
MGRGRIAVKQELEPFYSTGIASIQQADVLSAEDISDLSRYMDEMRQVFDTQVIWRTKTEALCSVLDDIHHPTPASKYHQCKLEQSVMFDQLILLSFDYREKWLELQEIRQKLPKAKGIDLAKLQIQAERCVYILDGMRRQAKDRLREVKMWSEIKQTLDDNTFDKDDKDTDQLLALTLNYCRQLPQAMRSQESAGATNIIAQSMTMLKECKKRGIQAQLGDAGKQAQKILGMEFPE